MFRQKFLVPLVAFVTVALGANLAWGIGFELGESKEKLKLKYDVSVYDHGTGRVTVTLKIADQGRLLIPAKQKNEDGGSYADLSVALNARDEDGKQVVRVHILRELAERADLQLKINHLDGEQQVLTWYYHSIPIAKHLKDAERNKQ